MKPTGNDERVSANENARENARIKAILAKINVLMETPTTVPVDVMRGVEDSLAILNAELDSLQEMKRRQAYRKEEAEIGFKVIYADEVTSRGLEYLFERPLASTYTLAIPENAPYEEAIAALSNLPFNKLDDFTQRNVIVGPILFPLSKIVGVKSFESWGGREDGTEKSARKIYELYKMPQSVVNDLDPSRPRIYLLPDKAGIYWGMAAMDGSHRTAAAKLRNDEFIEVENIYF